MKKGIFVVSEEFINFDFHNNLLSPRIFNRGWRNFVEKIFYYSIIIPKNKTSQNVPIPVSMAVRRLFSINIFLLEKIVLLMRNIIFDIN